MWKDSIFSWPDRLFYSLVLLLHVKRMGFKKNVPWREDFQLLNIRHEPWGPTKFILISVHNALWGAAYWKFSHSENISIFHGFAVFVWKRTRYTEKRSLIWPFEMYLFIFISPELFMSSILLLIETRNSKAIF